MLPSYERWYATHLGARDASGLPPPPHHASGYQDGQHQRPQNVLKHRDAVSVDALQAAEDPETAEHRQGDKAARPKEGG